MTWLQPWAAWFLAGLPLIVLLYLLKVRRRPATVSTLIFWQRVLEEHRRRALFQKLRHLFSLLLHLLIFVLIVAALARPTFDRLVQEGGSSSVIILDTRARMQAVEPDGETRFAKAVRLARQTIRDASASRHFAILTLGAQPNVVTPFTSNERTLDDTLQRIQVTDATGDDAAAVRLARELLTARPGQQRIIAISDAPIGGGIENLSVGTPLENVAITRFAPRPLPASPQTSEILIEVHNFGTHAVTTNLELRYDDRLLDVKPVSLAAGENITQIFPSVPRPRIASRGWLTAQLDIKDALPLDNIARAVLPPPHPVRVLLVTKGNVFLEKALSADPGASFELISPDAWSDAIAAKFDVIVHDDHLPPGNWSAHNSLFIKRTPFDKAGPEIEQPAVTDLDNEHPAVRLVDLRNTTILRAHPLELPATQDRWIYSAPLRSFDNPLLIVGEERGGHRVAALGLDLTATDLPLRIAFPLLITNTIHWLADARENTGRSLRAGEVLALAPGEQIIEPPASGFFQPLRNGFYESERDKDREWIAVNTFSDRESNLQHAKISTETTRAAAIPPVLSSFASWPLWRWLALGALALFTAEWSLFHRRRTE